MMNSASNAASHEPNSPIAGGDVEISITHDMAKRSWILFVPAAIILGVLRGLDASWAVVLAVVVILVNLYIAAEITRVAARISTSAIMAAVLGGFVVRLALVFAVALAVRNLDAIDFKVWLLSVAIGHVALLAWETHYISFSLAHPGVKQRKK